MPSVVDEDLDLGDEGWVAITKQEALERIERLLTEDLISIDVSTSNDPTPLGEFVTYTLIAVTEFDEIPVLLLARDVANPEGPGSWFIPKALVVPL